MSCPASSVGEEGRWTRRAALRQRCRNQGPEHVGLKLADRPPLPGGAGPAPPRGPAVPAIAYAPPPPPPPVMTTRGTAPARAPPFPSFRLQTSSPITAYHPKPFPSCSHPISIEKNRSRHNSACHLCPSVVALIRECARFRLPTGHRRWDPKNVSMWCGPGMPMPSMAELNNEGR